MPAIYLVSISYSLTQNLLAVRLASSNSTFQVSAFRKGIPRLLVCIDGSLHREAPQRRIIWEYSQPFVERLVRVVRVA